MAVDRSTAQRAVHRMPRLRRGSRFSPSRSALGRRISTATAMSALLLSAACSTSAPGCTPVPTTGFGAPVFSPSLGTKTDWSNLGPLRPYLASLPGGDTFYEVPWCEIEPQPGFFDWSDPDTVVNTAASLGFTTMLKIRVGQCWSTGKSPQYERGLQHKTESGMPLSLSAYADFVRRVVARYSLLGVHEYAIENEVNSPSFWAGTPAEFGTLVRTAARVIHASDPKAVVLDSGMSSTASGYGVANWLLDKGETSEAIDAYNSYFERRFGTRGRTIVTAGGESELRSLLDSDQGRRNAAYVAVTNRLVNTHVVDARQVHFYEQWSALPYLMQYLHANTPSNTPIEMWELGAFIGGPRLSVRERSAELVKTVALALSEGASKAVWIPLDVDSSQLTEEGTLFGLLGAHGRDQPAAGAFAAMSKAAQGAQAVAIRSPGITGVGFDRKGRGTAFVWAECGSTALRLPPGSHVHGLTKAARVPGSDRVRLGDDPVQIDLPTTVTELLKGRP
jgi:hypothetical protein